MHDQGYPRENPKREAPASRGRSDLNQVCAAAPSSICRYWSHYEKTIKKLLACTNTYYVNDSDKKGLVQDLNPLERGHLRYLLNTDPDILELQANKQNVGMFFHPFLFSFGLLGHNVDQIKELNSDIQSFMRTKNEAIFTLYLGVVNHWVCLVVHKTQEEPTRPRFYLLDSSNLVYLEKLDE